MGLSKKTVAPEAIKVLLCSVFVALMFYPFGRMVVSITWEDLVKVVTANTFERAIGNSLKIASLTTVISVSLGLGLAFAVQRSRIRFKGALAVLLTLPMLIPSISHGMGLVVLFGTNGILRELFGMKETIYGFWGLVTSSVLYSYPVAFLMFNDVLKYQDSSPYEAAEVLGIPKGRVLTAITLPFLVKPLISAVFTVFTLVVTDYGTPLMIGGKTTTLAVMMYQEVLGQLNFSKGSIIGLFLLIPAVITFIINLVVKSRSKLSYVTQPFVLKKNKARDGLAIALCGAVLLVIATLFSSFAMIAFTEKYPRDMTPTLAHIGKMLSLRGGDYLLNSLIIAVFVSVIGVAVAFLTAYMTARMRSKLSGLLHLFSITSLAIPGLVLGLSYAMTFGGSAIYGTLVILILANIMHFIASPYQMMYNSLCKMNENLESVGDTLGIGRVRMVVDVILPQCRATMAEMLSYFFVNSMMTISAVSFLATVATKPLSLMIGQFQGQVLYECAAMVSLVILLVNVLIKSVVYLINKRLTNKAAEAPANR